MFIKEKLWGNQELLLKHVHIHRSHKIFKDVHIHQSHKIFKDGHCTFRSNFSKMTTYYISKNFQDNYCIPKTFHDSHSA